MIWNSYIQSKAYWDGLLLFEWPAYNTYFIVTYLWGFFQDGCMYVFGGVSKIDRVRTNCLQRVWLATPTLQEICWEKITSCLDSETLKKTAYLSSFLPMQFIEKLSWHSKDKLS